MISLSVNSKNKYFQRGTIELVFIIHQEQIVFMVIFMENYKTNLFVDA